ncbi:MAG: tRNA-dihydrouridine synthase family protein, partial [Pseudobdellovibrionaceae bacterium]|nr:tRNA-dihydrouridine synthase family protein [Pseudobdellovibrionaceae bacterium]
MKKRRHFPLAKVNFPVFLAPMVGLSHRALRKLIRLYLPKELVICWPTEMLNSRRLPHENLNHLPEVFKDVDEGYFCPQLLGNDQFFLSQSIKKLEEWGAAAVDINMGCPVTKALKHNYGVALMGDPQYAANVVQWSVEAARVPISVKLRAGLQRDVEYLIQFVRRLVDAGASWVTLHPRLAHEARRGRADWDLFPLIRNAIAVPLIGNGDVSHVDDVFYLLETLQCDGVMIGRAAAAKPWLFAQVAQRMGYAPRRELPRNSFEEAREYFACCRRLWRELLIDYGAPLALRKFQFYIRMTHVWLDFGLRF